MQEVRTGAFFALAAYIIWGIIPIYFKAISSLDPLDVICHRIVWSILFLALLLSLQKKWHTAQEIFSCKRTVCILLFTSLLIVSNWLIFIWAVNNNHILEVSLGYYINPLVNVLLGMLFLRERLTPLQWIAVALATTGVMIQLVRFGSLPWVALSLAFSFGFYGLLRKKTRIDSVTGLFFETILLLPFALLYLAIFSPQGFPAMAANTPAINGLLIGVGVVTTIPLLFFTAAAGRLRLSTLGFFQYIEPSLVFFIALGMYNEPFTIDSGITFIFIWGALAFFSVDALRRNRRAQ